MARNASGRRKADTKPADEAPPRARPATAGSNTKKTAMPERRARILDVATRRFAESGFAATTVRQIADDVDILSGSLFHHFTTKEQMLHEILREPVLQMRDNAIRIARSPLDAEHRLVALILLDLGELTRNREVHAILYNERKLFRRREEFAYVVQAKKAEGNEEGERCLRPVCGGTKCVQPKYGNALHGADLLRAFFAIGQGLADEEVEKVHEAGELGVLFNISICDITRDKVNCRSNQDARGGGATRPHADQRPDDGAGIDNIAR